MYTLLWFYTCVIAAAIFMENWEINRCVPQEIPIYLISNENTESQIYSYLCLRLVNIAYDAANKIALAGPDRCDPRLINYPQGSDHLFRFIRGIVAKQSYFHK